MALKDVWANKVNGEDIVDADDINDIAQAVIEIEQKSNKSDNLPLMNGEASAGVSEEASRADHVHPTDTTRMPAIEEMSRKNLFGDNDKFAFLDSESGDMKFSYWSNLITKLWESVKSKVEESSVYSAYSVSTQLAD
jgi:hypothetical protein